MSWGEACDSLQRGKLSCNEKEERRQPRQRWFWSQAPTTLATIWAGGRGGE